MGEITDALRRARRERDRSERGAEGEAPRPAPLPLAPAPPAATGGDGPGEAAVQPVSRSKDGFWQARAVVVEPLSPVAERYRHLALRVRRALLERGARSLLVTSAVRSEGKTLTACNLALGLASVAAGSPVALLDLDLRRPATARALGLRPRAGIESVLAGRCEPEVARIATDVANLDVYPVVSVVRDAHDLLSRASLARLAEHLQSRYSLVICDCPPVLPVPDVPLIAPHFDSALLVTRSGVTRRSGFQEMLSLLPAGMALGSVLNDRRAGGHGSRYAYYRSDDAKGSEPGDRDPDAEE